ncbi:hypothetical protein QE390_003566 [Siphonobacter sp. SORGH_AS 1065]|nr:hypothetical protein [Siphonobacter sp. SORGH_AS_1065]
MVSEDLSITLDELIVKYHSAAPFELSYRQALDAQYLVAQRLKNRQIGDSLFDLLTIQVLVLESLHALILSTISYDFRRA